MYTEEDLASAVAEGVLSADAADALRAHVARQRDASAVDEERFRLVTGFNDVFVVVACALLLGSLSAIGTVVAGAAIAAALVAVAAWGLAEFFTRKRRMALPSIVLTLAFAGGLFAACIASLQSGLAVVGGAFLVTAGMGLHWKRFRVPIAVAVGAAAVVGIVIGSLVAFWPDARAWLLTLCFVGGLAVFAFALRWDASDTRRQTRRSDVAFWLHLLAAPLIVHPVFRSLGVYTSGDSAITVVVVIGLYVALALVSLAIDRRALMVSALGYVLYAFSALMSDRTSLPTAFAFTGLAIGGALLTLSAFWHLARRAVLRALPESLRQRLPTA